MRVMVESFIVLEGYTMSDNDLICQYFLQCILADVSPLAMFYVGLRRQLNMLLTAKHVSGIHHFSRQ